MAAIAACVAAGPKPPVVRPGIEVLLSDSIALVQGRRVGLLTNHAGVDRAGVEDLDRLLRAGVHVTAIFAPEHGYRGSLDRDNIGNMVDSATGIPIFSLYGTARAPTAAMLAEVDVLLIDLPDIGARTYTYVSTAVLAMKAVAALGGGRRVVVLDRPNPIGGLQVQGPVLDTALTSFIGALPVPLRHGMTLGELARFANARLSVGAPLTVVPAAGWQRGVWFDATGLPWIRPSPNMPDLESATHYPGIVLFEATNLSVGRGTPIAFQVVGAPWLDRARVRAALGDVPGVAIADTTVTPQEPGDAKYAGRQVRALRFRVTHRDSYDPVRLAVRLLAAIRQVQRDSLRLDAHGLDQRAGTAGVREAIEAGRRGDDIWRGWESALARFRRDRAPFLLY